MPSYDSFMCPNCEHYFRVIWPDAMPNHHDPCSKIKMKCPDRGEVTELYDFLIDKILQAPEPDIPSVEVLSISPRDPRPNPDARIEWQQQIFIRRAARFKAMHIKVSVVAGK